MKYSNIDINSKTHAIPDVRFEEEKLTSFGGLVVFQLLLKSLNLKHRLRLCLERGQPKKTYGHATIVLLLVVHITLGYRRLSDVKFYQHDPMMKHLHGLNSLPDDSTLSRRLNSVTQEHVDNLATLMQKLVVDRCVEENLTRITLDFDGSVISSKRYAEGSTIGYNKKTRASVVTIHCFVQSLKLGKYLIFFIDPVMFMTRMALTALFSLIYAKYGSICPK